MREVYLDNSATTKVHKNIVDVMNQIMLEDYGNPSSKHHMGFVCENFVKDATKNIANTLKCKDKEIIFTSGGTESNNMAIIGTALANEKRGKHIISSNFEHAAVYKPLEFLESKGFEITILPVDKDGHINIIDLQNAIRKDTILVSIMHINNEIGAINDIKQIGTIVKNTNKNTLFHTDAIQSFGKLYINPSEMNIDLLSVSGHKIHAPKGSGFIFIKEGTNISPIIFGGGQQKNYRSGTHNVPGIVGIGMASKIAYDNIENNVKKIIEIKNKMILELNKLNEIIGGIYVNSKMNLDSAPHILSCSFENVKAEVLLHALEDKCIYVSSGSACSSNHPGISGTLKAIGLNQNLLDSTIRFSFSLYNEIEDIDYTINELKTLIPTLRKFIHK